MKPINIKYYAIFFILAGFIFVSCDHKNTEREYSERENDVNEKTNQNLNEDASIPGGYINMDSTDLGENKGNLPLKVYNAIRNDSSLRHQELVDSRPLTKENEIFFEVHFKLDDKITTVIFDKDGNHSSDFN